MYRLSLRFGFCIGIKREQLKSTNIKLQTKILTNRPLSLLACVVYGVDTTIQHALLLYHECMHFIAGDHALHNTMNACILMRVITAGDKLHP